MEKNSLAESMDNAVKHYASLFKLPSHMKVVSLQAMICIGGGVTSAITLFHASVLSNVIPFAFLLFLISQLLDLMTNLVILRQDPIYDLRRIAVVSLFGWMVWFSFILTGTVVAIFLGLSWWVKFCLLGFSAVLAFRLIVFEASSTMNLARLHAASLLQPLVCVLPFVKLWLEVGYAVTTGMLLFFIVSPIIGLISTWLFLSLLDRVGMKTLGISSLTLFRAFLLNWTVGLSAPFEDCLERLGEEQDVEVSLIKFDSLQPKAAIIVPSIHPGPFKNIGSSNLPSLLKDAVEKHLGYITCVPLGLQGHELDLASQLQNQKIIDHVTRSMDFEASKTRATPFVKTSYGMATACCQIFGSFAFLSFTLAPKTTEDLPQELGLFVRQESKKHGLTACVVVNAHNSIDGMALMPEVFEGLKSVAVDCLDKAASFEQRTFHVGASNVVPKEFGVSDGMGSGGITVLVVKVLDQKVAYVVIDGNNMVSGLREEILSDLRSLGIDEGEVFTTDTHAVSAVILGPRGYHPVGEAISHEKLIGYINEATLNALKDLKRARAGCSNITVPKVKVIGERRLKGLSLLTEEVLQRAKKIIAPIFALSGLLLMLFLLFV